MIWTIDFNLSKKNIDWLAEMFLHSDFDTMYFCYTATTK